MPEQGAAPEPTAAITSRVSDSTALRQADESDVWSSRSTTRQATVDWALAAAGSHTHAPNATACRARGVAGRARERESTALTIARAGLERS